MPVADPSSEDKAGRRGRIRPFRGIVIGRIFFGWDQIKAVGTVIAAFVAGVWITWTYFQGHYNDRKRPFYETQMRLCFEASDAAAILATANDEKTLQKAHSDFWRFYWGNLAIVEDVSVSRAMVAFGHSLRLESGKVPNQSELVFLSLAIAEKCRDMIRAEWSIDILPSQAIKDRR